MKKVLRILVLLMLFIIMMNSTVVSEGVPQEQVKNESKAVVLKNLGLFLGSDRGFELERAPTRAEAAVMLVRLLGKQNEALNTKASIPFKDVPAWAVPHVGYMYANGLTKGVTADMFGSNDFVTAGQYTTFVLRSLGYSDTAGDFNYSHVLDYTWDVGLIDTQTFNSLKSKTFLRDDVVKISYNALSSVMKGSTKRLINKLIESGVVTKSQAEENSINTNENFYETIDYGTINNVEHSDSVEIIIDSINGGIYKQSEKTLGRKIDKSKLTDMAKGYTKIGERQLAHKPDKELVEEYLRKISPNNNIHTWIENGYSLFYLGRGNYHIIGFYDASDTLLAYTVVHYLGFQEDETYQDITYRYKPVHIEELSPLPEFDCITIYKSAKRFTNAIIDREKLPYEIRNFSVYRFLSISMKGEATPEAIRSINFEKILKEGYGKSRYIDEINRGAEGGTSNVFLLTIYDENDKLLGYCCMRAEINVEN